MSTLPDVRSLIVSVNANTFLGDAPDTPDNCVMIYATGGIGTLHNMGAVTNKAAEQQSIQIRIRNTDYATAVSEANQIKEILDGYNNTIVNTDLYQSIFLDSDILSIGKDDRGRNNLTLNFTLKKKEAT